jgi:hypothetical protein
MIGRQTSYEEVCKMEDERGHYKVMENKNRRVTIKLEATGRQVCLRLPKFRDREKLMEVMGGSEMENELKNAYRKIARDRKINIREAMELAENGSLTSEEEEILNNITAGREQDAMKNIETIMNLVINLPDDEKERLLEDLDIDEGVSLLKGAIIFINEKMTVTKEEEKK